MKTGKETATQLDYLIQGVEGVLNDFESGISEKEETIKFLVYYIGERVSVAVKSNENQWKSKIKKALEATTNFHCKNTLKDLLEGE